MGSGGLHYPEHDGIAANFETLLILWNNELDTLLFVDKGTKQVKELSLTKPARLNIFELNRSHLILIADETCMILKIG